MRLIDAERLDVFSANCPNGRDIQSFMDGVIAVLNEMDKFPTINLVFCKDCKHGKPGDCGYGVDCDCDDVWHKDDWFCADGKRREENEAD